MAAKQLDRPECVHCKEEGAKFDDIFPAEDAVAKDNALSLSLMNCVHSEQNFQITLSFTCVLGRKVIPLTINLHEKES
jgi:hypothetical protein